MPKTEKSEADPRLGAKVRSLRRRENLSQAQLAQRLGVSASYLNLIEANRRPLPAGLLIKLAQQFSLDVTSFAADGEARLSAELLEAFADPLFESHGLTTTDLRELATGSPAAARAVLALYRAYRSARQSAETLASQVVGDEPAGAAHSLLPSEEVSDLIQDRQNHFPELEAGAERLWREAKLDPEELAPRLVRHLEAAHGVQVRIGRGLAERGVLRRFDAARKTLTLSELLPTRSRTFQLAHQLALLGAREGLDRLVQDGRLTSEESRTLARVALANYFAGAVLMPYGPFLSAAREERYDIDVLGRRFRVGFEQVCHRLTTLRRPGAEGVPFHMLRIDVAGNLSKRFSSSGIHFARFSGACPRWNVFQAFLTPGLIRTQISRMTDGSAYFCVARTLQHDSGGYHAQPPVQALALGCRLQDAKELVYSDGIDLTDLAAAVPVGTSCRLCERMDCAQRAFPSLRQPLQLDENLRGVSLYARVDAT